MVYCQHGNDGNIWTPPQVVALPWEVENISFKSIWSDGCEDLYSKLNTQSVVNGGKFPNIEVHQLFLFLRVIVVSSDKASQGSNKMEDHSTFLLLVIEFLLMGGKRKTSQVLFLLYFAWGQEGRQSREKIA